LRFSILDLLILAILAYSIVRSTMRGFMREIYILVSVLVGSILASWFYRPVGNLFKDVVRTENLALFLGFSLIFVGTLVAGAVVTWLVTRFMKRVKLQWADQLLGAAFGFIRGWMIGAVVLLVLTAFDVQTERIKNSALAPYFLPGSRAIAVITPYELKAKFLVGYRSLESWWQQLG
jgi:membrane protein required for colicin V production